MGANDIVLRITGKADVKTAALQAQKDLDGAFGGGGMMGALLGKKSDMSLAREAIKGGIIGMAAAAFTGGVALGEKISEGISEGLNSKEGLLRHFWDKLTGYDKIAKKNSEEFAKSVSSQAAAAAKASSDNLNYIAQGMRKRTEEGELQNKINASYDAAVLKSQDVWAAAAAERMTEAEKLASAQLTAENDLQAEVEKTTDLIRLRRKEVADKSNVSASLGSSIEVDKRTLTGLPNDEENKAANDLMRKTVQDRIDATQKLKDETDSLLEKSKADVMIQGNILSAQRAQVAALRDQNDAKMMRYSIEQFISDEEAKQGNLNAVAIGQANNRKQLDDARLQGYARFAAMQKAEIADAEQAITMQARKVGLLRDALEISKSEGALDKVEQLKKQLAAEEAIGVVLKGNLETQKQTAAILAKRERDTVTLSLIQTKLNESGVGSRGGVAVTPEEAVLGIAVKGGGFRARGIGDSGLQQRMADYANADQRAADKAAFRQAARDQRSLASDAAQYEMQAALRRRFGTSEEDIKKQLGNTRGAEAVRLLKDAMDKADLQRQADILNGAAMTAMIDSANYLSHIERNLLRPL